MLRLKNKLLGSFPVNSKRIVHKLSNIFRHCHNSSLEAVQNEPIASSNFVTFDEMIKGKKREAEKSLVIQVNSENSYQELFNYCSQFGEIKNAFHYQISEEKSHFILLEYQELASYQEALRNSQFNPDNSGVSVISPFLWFKALSTRKAQRRSEHEPPPLQCNQKIKLLSDSSFNNALTSAESLDDQMKILHRETCLNDLGIRMRFVLAKQLEAALSGMFPFIQAYPFGSSVNGFGKTGCDLDLILRVNKEQQNAVPESRLIFHTKANLLNERSQTQRQMEAIGDILYLFLPGVSSVRRILQARVPIIKFNHECLGLEVDLSMSNMTGVYMSELLYLYGEIDDRVRPLTFCIRKWASMNGLTNSSPGRWISNFSLTVLVLFFLQQLKKPILPPLNVLVKSARKNDIRIADESISCTFLRDILHLKFQRDNDDSLSDLLTQFFEFYSQFDFSTKGISLSEGKFCSKGDHSAMWITNPFEQLVNVSKNVSLEEVERFRFEVRNAAWILEQSREEEKDPNVWGLLSLFKTNKQIIKPQMFFKSRLVDVSQLFNGDEDNSKVNFKNPTTKKQVTDIRQANKKEMRKLDLRFKRR